MAPRKAPRLGSRAIFVALAGVIVVAVGAFALAGRHRETTTAVGVGAPAITAAPQAETPGGPTGEAEGGPTGEPGTTEPCHFPTTVPGGTEPQPRCEEADAMLDGEPSADAGQGEATPTGPPFTCPTDEVYPAVIVSTNWSPATEPPSFLPACHGGEAAPANGTILVPTSPLAGLDPALGVGVALFRQPGGLAEVGTVAIPATRDDRLVELSTYTMKMPERIGEIAAAVDGRCAEGSATPLVVRGADGCIVGDTAVWVEGPTRYELSRSPDLAVEWSDIAAWLATWRSI